MSKLTDKINNVKLMFKELVTIYSLMGDSKIKTDYMRLLTYIRSNSGDLKKVLEHIEKQIKQNQKAISGNRGYVNIWKRIREIILKTIELNKQIDRS